VGCLYGSLPFFLVFISRFFAGQLQPLDQVFGTVKSRARRAWKEHILGSFGEKLDYAHAVRHLVRAWYDTTKSQMSDSFSRCLRLNHATYANKIAVTKLVPKGQALPPVKQDWADRKREEATRQASSRREHEAFQRSLQEAKLLLDAKQPVFFFFFFFFFR
jgi:hypothetical protein